MADLPAYHRRHRWSRATVATALMVSAWLLALAWRPAFAPITADDTAAYSRAWARSRPQLADAAECVACHPRHGRSFAVPNSL